MNDVNQNLKESLDELLRNFKFQDDVFNRQTRTLEFMMGLIIAVLAYMINQPDFFSIISHKNMLLVYSFWSGIILFSISGVLAFFVYKPLKIDAGPEPKEFTKKYVNESNENFKLNLFREINESNEKNRKKIWNRAKRIRLSYILLGFGFSLILITKIIYNIGLIV